MLWHIGVLAREVIDALGLKAQVREVPVETTQEAERHRFLGSPSVRINGRDIEPGADGDTDFTIGCRMYGITGIPPRELFIAALEAAATASSRSVE